MSSTDRIEKQIVLKATRARVWRALTDAGEFGAWFRVKLEGPFVVGQRIKGRMLYPGYEHLVADLEVVAIEPQHRFAYRWHPYAVDPAVDYAQESPTTVEFTLAETDGGMRVTVTESGFDALPAARRDEAFRMNEGGWVAQMKNLEVYVAGQ